MENDLLGFKLFLNSYKNYVIVCLIYKDPQYLFSNSLRKQLFLHIIHHNKPQLGWLLTLNNQPPPIHRAYQ